MEGEKCLDSQLWHACAGSMVQMPHLNTKVFYFPQGHAEHANGNVDFGNYRWVPCAILCRVLDVKFLADPESDEVFAKIRLVPVRNNEPGFPAKEEDNGVVLGENREKTKSFAKTLTQSDANNGGGFSVPRYCAENIFPTLDYSKNPPVQNISAKDVHGKIWKFRHIFRGTPRRHLLTTGWSIFVNHKKLIAGDSIVFLKSENGEISVGIRRAKRGKLGGGNESSTSELNPASCFSQLGIEFSVLAKGEERAKKASSDPNSNGGGGFRRRGKVEPESVIEAANLAANGLAFEVAYYPRSGTPEFFVKAEAVLTAMRTPWCSGMRFKMPFETEDSSRISCFMGTTSGIQVADPVHWPDSPWRLLQVTWDEPDLLQNVKRVSPWLVELVTNMPTINLSPMSLQRKKQRLPQHHDFPLDGQFLTPAFSGNPLGASSHLDHPSDNKTLPGIQGTRHPTFFHLFPPTSFQQHDHAAPSSSSSTGLTGNPTIHDNVSGLLNVGTSSLNKRKFDNGNKPQLILFGQPIYTEPQISLSSSGDAVSPVLTGNSSDGNPDKVASFPSDGLPENSSYEGFPWFEDRQASELGVETGLCKVFMASEDVGRSLDLSVLGSYDELYRRLASMFGIERSEMLSHVLYRDAAGAVKQTGQEPFSDFMKTARRLTILMDWGIDNIGR